MTTVSEKDKAFDVMLAALVAIRKSSSATIADNLPSDWGVDRLQAAAVPVPRCNMLPFNAMQKIALDTYSKGEFSDLIAMSSQVEIDLAISERGDSLLRFILVELSDSEDCHDADEAVRRMASAAEDLVGIQHMLLNGGVLE